MLSASRVAQTVRRLTGLRFLCWGGQGCGGFDTAIMYDRVAVMARENTRTAKPAVRATCFGLLYFPSFLQSREEKKRKAGSHPTLIEARCYPW
ncbi:MAG TPA: hypothetical protein VG028_03845 [Terriglobia bacterium]|nr:hypothetical protein [Terriglobia bacterium]